MENKKTFGAYILRRRKELNLTQREFAEKLYVTESAVSKWERGVSYPDITLLRSICSVLDISEHELLTGSEDTQRRTSERLATKYLRLTRNYRISQYILYGLALLACAAANLSVQHTLDWFFIVFASVLMAASFTLAPAIAAMHPRLSCCKAAVSAGCFLASLELLLLICCIYSGGSWFPVAGIAVIFGFSLILLPFLLPTIPLPAGLERRKTSVYLVTETVLLLLLLLICCLYTGGSWFFMAASGVVFGLSFFILPVLLKQLPVPEAMQEHKTLLFFMVETVLLILLLLVADLYSGAGEFLTVSLPVGVTCLLLPWGILLALRYLPVNRWFRAAASTLWTAVWIWFFPVALDWILTPAYGPSINRYTLSMWLQFDFSVWNSMQTSVNVLAILLMVLLVSSAVFGVMGVISCRKQKNSIS